MQIHHVVALSDAWQKGAQLWDEGTRRNFANDPQNLQAADGPANQQKGDGDAVTWLPANRDFWCAYFSRQVAVKAEYGLWMTKAEHDRITEVLTEDCDGTPPEPATPTTSSAQPLDPPGIQDDTAPAEPPVTTAIAPEETEPAQEPDTSGVYYENCGAVRAAGADPIYPGDPGFQPKFDGNNVGVGCE